MNISEHYNEVGARYDRLYQLLFGGHEEAVARLIAKKLFEGKNMNQVVVDLGGGTGMMIELLKGMVADAHTFILVEPAATMLRQAVSRKAQPNQVIQATAQEFVADKDWQGKADALVCKEMIHHITDLDVFFEGCYRTLKSEGKILILTRPEEIEFPLGANGKKLWKSSYAVSPQEMPHRLEKAGFEVKVETHSFPIVIDKHSWLEIIGESYLFSSSAFMTDHERAADVQEVQAMPEILRFNDRLLFIMGKKSNYAGIETY